MVGSLLLRGMLAGLLAGLLAAAFGALAGEPSIERAIAYESAAAQAAGEPPEPEIVSRDVQRGPGLFAAAMVYGAALGGFFGLAFAFAHGRIGGGDPRAVAALLATAGFVALALAPALKYPANPPAIGAADTIGARTALFFIMMFASLTAMILAAATGRNLAARFGAWRGALTGVVVFVTAALFAGVLLPSVNEVPADFPADLLWRFRLASLGTQAVLWSAIGFGFALLTPTARHLSASD
ncbi:CbtA family protein [Methylocapsa acidiphila]|uniref:CbtA family protein n=1 Tax=Methylocapsa acidiphila TaxID=133552 RepID=UPI00040F3165|nr:CbtA family protein [Methylocapsa acidiphila]